MTESDQLTRADVTRMFRDGQYEDIAQAKAEGRLNQLLGIDPTNDTTQEN